MKNILWFLRKSRHTELAAISQKGRSLDYVAELKKVYKNDSNHFLQVIGAYRTCFSDQRPETEIVLEDLAAICRFYRSSFCKTDPYETAFNEGARMILIHIMNIININDSDL